jgi:hypothetical protein
MLNPFSKKFFYPCFSVAKFKPNFFHFYGPLPVLDIAQLALEPICATDKHTYI